MIKKRKKKIITGLNVRSGTEGEFNRLACSHKQWLITDRGRGLCQSDACHCMTAAPSQPSPERAWKSTTMEKNYCTLPPAAELSLLLPKWGKLDQFAWNSSIQNVMSFVEESTLFIFFRLIWDIFACKIKSGHFCIFPLYFLLDFFYFFISVKRQFPHLSPNACARPPRCPWTQTRFDGQTQKHSRLFSCYTCECFGWHSCWRVGMLRAVQTFLEKRLWESLVFFCLTTTPWNMGALLKITKIIYFN